MPHKPFRNCAKYSDIRERVNDGDRNLPELELNLLRTHLVLCEEGCKLKINETGEKILNGE